VPCQEGHSRCEWAGRSGSEKPGPGASPEEVRKAVEAVMAPMMREVGGVKRAMREMRDELWGTLKGVYGLGSMPDEEWTSQAETLRHWEEWGREGGRYAHLPRIRAEDLKTPEEESGGDSEEEAELSEGELQLLREEAGSAGYASDGGAGKKKVEVEVEASGSEDEGEDDEDEEGEEDEGDEEDEDEKEARRRREEKGKMRASAVEGQ
jgi:hypothetical protein